MVLDIPFVVIYFDLTVFLSLHFLALICFHTNLNGDCKHKLPSCCSPVLLALGFLLTVANSCAKNVVYSNQSVNTHEASATFKYS